MSGRAVRQPPVVASAVQGVEGPGLPPWGLWASVPAAQAPGPGERGSAGALSVLAILVLATVAGVAGLVVSLLVVRAKVDAAADLGALAGAAVVLEGQGTACARASAVVAANGGHLQSCTVAGASLQLEVWAPAPPAVARLVPAGRAVVRARSRAELVGASGSTEITHG